MGSQAGSASVFVLKAADALQAALALEGGEHGDDELAAADQRYQDAIRDLSCAAAFETRGAAFTAAQRSSIAVLKSRRAQLERRLGGGSVVARDTPQRREQLQLAPQLHPLPPPQGLREGPMTPPRDDPGRAPVLGRLSTRSGTVHVEPYYLPVRVVTYHPSIPGKPKCLDPK